MTTAEYSKLLIENARKWPFNKNLLIYRLIPVALRYFESFIHAWTDRQFEAWKRSGRHDSF